MRLKRPPLDLPAIALTLCLGTAGGLLADLLGLPLALLLGSLVAVGAAAALGLRPMGHDISVPQGLRNYFVPVIGVAIGASFTPAVLVQAASWWPSLIGLLFYIPAAHFIAFQIYRRIGLLRPATAFFSAVPGGLIESVTLGEMAGADVPMLILLQFLRLILTIITVPLIFLLLTGQSVGSSAGMAMAGTEVPLMLPDVAVLLAAGILGYVAGHRLHLPAAVMTGPLLASAAAHFAGLTTALPPGWLVAVTQIVVGTTLGARFAGLPAGTLARGLWLSVLNSAAGLGMAYGFAVVLAGMVGQPLSAAFLAFAPGGVAEMSLIALSLQISVVYVTTHHVARIILSVLIARVAGPRVLGPGGG